MYLDFKWVTSNNLGLNLALNNFNKAVSMREITLVKPIQTDWLPLSTQRPSESSSVSWLLSIYNLVTHNFDCRRRDISICFILKLCFEFLSASVKPEIYLIILFCSIMFWYCICTVNFNIKIPWIYLLNHKITNHNSNSILSILIVFS